MIRYCLFATSLFVSSSVTAGIPWPSKTGPSGNGVYSTNAGDSLPLEWDEESGKNIAWKIEVEGFGHSTPVIGEGRVWFTSASEDGKKQYVYCVDENSGEVVHHKLLFENEDPEPLNNPINNYAAPSCTLEEGAVYVHFGTYGTARLNASTGDVVWQRRDINARHFRGPGSSPIIFEDLLILTFDGIDTQFVTALDKSTGATVWKTDRTTDYKDLDDEGKPKREGDMRKAYGTPAVVEADGKSQVVSIGSMAAFGYDARTGEELWTITHDDMNASAQPIAIADSVILNTGGRGSNLISLRLDGKMTANIEDSHTNWNRPKGNSRMAFPVLSGKRLVFVSDTGVVTSVDPESGKNVWVGRIGGNHIASPIVAGGYVYFFTIEGETIVIDGMSDSLKIICKNVLDEGMRASPAAANGALFLRTHGHLYKIAQ